MVCLNYSSGQYVKVESCSTFSVSCVIIVEFVVRHRVQQSLELMSSRAGDVRKGRIRDRLSTSYVLENRE